MTIANRNAGADVHVGPPSEKFFSEKRANVGIGPYFCTLFSEWAILQQPLVSAIDFNLEKLLHEAGLCDNFLFGEGDPLRGGYPFVLHVV